MPPVPTKRVVALASALLLALPAAAAGNSPAKWLYVLHCSGCHGKAGAGAPDAGIPDFNHSIGNILRHADGKRYVVNVAGVRNAGLGDDDVANVLNYIIESWGDGAAPPVRFDAKEVGRLKTDALDIVATRKEIERYLDDRGLQYSRYPW